MAQRYIYSTPMITRRAHHHSVYGNRPTVVQLLHAQQSVDYHPQMLQPSTMSIQQLWIVVVISICLYTHTHQVQAPCTKFQTDPPQPHRSRTPASMRFMIWVRKTATCMLLAIKANWLCRATAVPVGQPRRS